MANRFFSPDQQFADSTGAALNGAQLFFYTAGTSTKLNTYSDKALSIANTNPVVLDSSGRAGSIFLQNLAYKVVLAPFTDTDPPTSPIWTIDNVWTSDFSATAQFLSNAGNPNGSVAGTAGSAGVPASAVYDSTNKILYVCTTTGNAAVAVWTAVNPPTLSGSQLPTGRLTPQTVTPVLNSDVTSATSVFYTPYLDNTVPIYNGTTFAPTTFTELTLTLNNPAHAASTLYDVFVFSNSGTLTLVTGPAWSSSTGGASSRGTGASSTQLSMILGHLTNAVSITGRNGSTTYSINANLATYLGTIFIDGTAGQVTCHIAPGQSRKYGIWNAFNRVSIVLRVFDSTSSWTYSTNTWRSSNNNSANSATCVLGLTEENIASRFVQNLNPSTGTGSITTTSMQIGIGLNITNGNSAMGGEASVTPLGGSVAFSTINTATATGDTNTAIIGMNVFNAVEIVPTLSTGSGAAATFLGNVANMNFTVSYRG